MGQAINLIKITKTSCPPFEKKVFLVVLNEATFKQRWAIGYLKFVDAEGPHFRSETGNDLRVVTHYAEMPELPKVKIRKTRRV